MSRSIAFASSFEKANCRSKNVARNLTSKIVMRDKKTGFMMGTLVLTSSVLFFGLSVGCDAPRNNSSGAGGYSNSPSQQAPTNSNTVESSALETQLDSPNVETKEEIELPTADRAKQQ